MKKIIITGASEGIGWEIAKLLAERGDQLTLVARNREKLEKAIANLSGKGHQFLSADLSKKEDIHAIADHISQNSYDALINNAGIGMYGRFEEMALNLQVNMIHLNIYGLTVLNYSFLKNAKSGDSLVNVASTLGTSSFPGTAVYAATKAYVTILSESLWWENKRKGIYVMGFCPGVTLTNFHQTAGSSSDKFPKFICQTPAEVARELIHSLEKRKKPKTVSGVSNRFMLFFHRFLSRKIVVNMMGSFSPIKGS
jgi:short-subunit dehydrogenase